MRGRHSLTGMSDPDGPLDIAMLATTVYVADLDEAIEWYRDKLGFEPTTRGTDEWRFAGYLLGGVFLVPPGRPGRGSTLDLELSHNSPG